MEEMSHEEILIACVAGFFGWTYLIYLI